MSIILIKKRKHIAWVLLLIMLMNILQPFSVFALTSGPGQPESQSFQPAGVSDMVDLFSGDFKYNIPLIDIDGYPINLNYQSGVSMDDEASWVGLGWNLNAGSINRQVRGIPDDYAGDEIKTDHYTKPKITVGGRLTLKAEIKGKKTGDNGDKVATGNSISGSLTFGIFSDNYTGIGAEIGANAGISVSLVNDNMLTAGLGLGVLSSTANGVDTSPNVSLSVSEHSKTENNLRAGLSASLGYNSRSGLKTANFGRTFMAYDLSAPGVSYNTEPIMPKVQVPYLSTYESYSIDVGGAAFAFFGGGGGTGYKSVRSVLSQHMSNPGYGFLYAEQGKNKKNAVMDFSREKDNPVIPELPNLALPVHTPDIFSYTSQNGSGQFRLFRGGTGIFFDNESADKSSVKSTGGDFGGGAYFHGGLTHFEQTTSSTSRKWTTKNNYLKAGDFQDLPTDPNRQHVFFKKTDEKNIEDVDITNKLLGTNLLSISTSEKTANSAFVNQTTLGSTVTPVSTAITKGSRQVQNTAISYLTANEADKAGLDKTINTYAFNTYDEFVPPDNNAPVKINTESRKNNSIKKNHHISEITVNDNGGQRVVYGLPVYNLKHEEYSFAVGSNYSSNDGLVALSPGGITRNLGIDHYYHMDSQAPYAYNYLLTGVLSPDYMDKTGDGITDDDDGTAIKFDYSRIDNYKWRTPYNNQNTPTASLNRGLLADPDDDKASILYGEKEIYYISSIESKTKIAYFITSDRLDGLGVKNLNGERDPNIRQKCLREIRLYSKANLTKPIKVVKFEYAYDLCPGTPNSIAPGAGKLTLKKVWFEYGLTHKGANFPYVFKYNKALDGTDIPYGTMKTDRWGTYKSPDNNRGDLTNEEYPYTNQNKAKADLAAALWHIQSIELPSGGKIEVNYEADDYAYVQDKRAMEMVPFQMLETSGSLEGATGIRIAIEDSPPQNFNVTDWFKQTYLNGSDYIYTKSYVKVSTPNASSDGKDYDYVPVYCKISSVAFRNGKAEIKFEPINESKVKVNPIRSAAWQRQKNEYPRYAYPGFRNRVSDNGGGGVSAAVSAIISAAKNLSELKQNFYQKADSKGYAKVIDESKSFAKICKTSGFKIGGGVRVKKITISDNWDEFTGQNVPKGIYGQSYDYTTITDGKKISSGVASYEPSVGNDENPLKQPVPYVQNIKGAINNFFELEEPFGESLFPAPGVGYSKITVRDLEAGDTEAEYPETGFVTNEFYTAKDFPVKVSFSPIHRYNPKQSNTYSLLKTQSVQEMVLSQGYSIELNDMHGKPKANRIYNKSGSEISSTEYFYQVEDQKATPLKLNNTVQVIDANGSVSNKIIGRDIELFTDFREQETINSGKTINIGVDIFPAFFGIPFGLPHKPTDSNNEYKLFRSACAVKVIQTNGIINKVVKTENGSSIAIENVAYDGVTGEALITKTQNEFNEYYYNVNLPAYWVYKGMGPAYQTLGTLLQNLITDTKGTINNSIYSSFVMPGDELVDIDSGNHYWVIETSGAKRLIDRDGKVQQVNVAVAKIIRSGYRNLLQPATSTLVCLADPIENGQLKLTSGGDLSSLKVINASTNLFDEKWALEKVVSQPVDNGSVFYENTSQSFEFCASPGQNINSIAVYNSPSDAPILPVTSSYWKTNANSGPYFRAGIKLCETDIIPDSTRSNSIGFGICITVPETKTYYAGLAAPNFGQISPFIGFGGFRNYWIFYKMTLFKGKNYLQYSFPTYYYSGEVHKNDAQFNFGAFEIYDNTIQELLNADAAGTGINTIFSSGSLRNQEGRYTTKFFGDMRYYHYANSSGQTPIPCDENIFYDEISSKINPYITGFLGNWRPYQTKVYQESRAYGDIFNPTSKRLNINKSGYFNAFNSWWKVQGNTWVGNSNPKWVTANTITQYDKYGQELENKDALNRYSAATFDFNGQLPAAVASNAMNREIYTNGFEDALLRSKSVASTNNNFANNLISKTAIISNNVQSYTSAYLVTLNSYGSISITQNSQPYQISSTKNESTGISALNSSLSSSSSSSTSSSDGFISASPSRQITDLLSSEQSHTGNYSLKLDASGIVLTTQIHSREHKTSDYLVANENGFSGINKLGLYPNGFEPVPTKKYIINAWVKDGQATNRNVNASVTINGTDNVTRSVPMTCKAVVEGWKLLEGTIDLNTISGTKLQVNIKSNLTGVYIDDIRIHPYDAHLKSYVYDDKNFKLMAELDENGFATFYEYDNEGSLIRVKKETERGIMTIKENRSSYRKKN